MLSLGNVLVFVFPDHFRVHSGLVCPLLRLNLRSDSYRLILARGQCD